MGQNTKMYKAKLIDGKLMLTSSDIQVGDEVLYLIGNEIRKVVSREKALEITGNSPSYEWCELEIARNEKYHVKVIGEISPEATWVKEGDEFEESEIEKKVNLGTALSPFYRFWIEGRDKIGYKCVVFIKGPCGHFH